jgi:hypothetical protein
MTRNAMLAAAVLLAAGLAMIRYVPADAGGVMKGGANVEAALGLRFLGRVPQNAAPGQTAEAIVMDPSKLATFGLTGLSRNEKVRLTAGESGRFTVSRPGGGAAPAFIIGDSGKVRLAGPARTAPAAPLRAAPLQQAPAPKAAPALK